MNKTRRLAAIQINPFKAPHPVIKWRKNSNNSCSNCMISQKVSPVVPTKDKMTIKKVRLCINCEEMQPKSWIKLARVMALLKRIANNSFDRRLVVG